MSEIDRSSLVSAMRRLSIQAGAAIMEIYNSDDLGVKIKDDQSPVTAADEAADAIISAGLRAQFSDVMLVTEEQKDTHDLSAGTFLIVDPLDGTKEFVKRRGDFTVNIALVEDNQPTLGVVYAPAKGRMFITPETGGCIEETGAFDLDTVGETKPIQVETATGPLRIVASKSHSDQATEDYIAMYDVESKVSAGSSLKFCLVATGEAHFYPRLGPTMEWDTAAGHAVLSAAGGQVVHRDTHERLVYGKPGFLNSFFLAYAPGVSLVKE